MSHDNRNCNHGHGAGLLLAALLGGAAGAAATYFAAPRSGVDSRRRIAAMADDARETAERFPTALRKATAAAREAFERALETG